MSTIFRTLRNLRKVGLKVGSLMVSIEHVALINHLQEYGHQMQVRSQSHALRNTANRTDRNLSRNSISVWFEQI